MKRMRKGVIILAVFMAAMLLSTAAFGAAPKVYDKAGLFTGEEAEVLENNAAALGEQLKLDLVIVTINDNEGKTSRDYADDFYDENGFGYGENKDGALLLINMQDREVYISTCGAAIKYLTDARLNNILDKVYPYLSDGKYSDGAAAFLDQVKYYVDMGIPSPSGQSSSGTDTGEYSPGNSSTGEDASVDPVVVYLVVSLVIGALVVGIMANNNRGKVVVNENSYLAGNSINLTDRTDIHVDTRVTHVTIRSQSSSGGSSTHSSSSGRTHGGGGRKF